MLKIKQYELGPMENFIYLIYDSVTLEAILIDPAWNPDFILNELKEYHLTLTKILLTHGHFDHVKHIPDILQIHPVPVYLSQHEAPSLTPEFITHLTKDTDKIRLGNYEIICLHTPGHTPGGQSFYVEPYLFTGDTLFIDGCGRANFENSNATHLYESLERIKCLPDETIIFPGHHYGNVICDTLENQKKTNRFLKAATKETFIRLRMAPSKTTSL